MKALLLTAISLLPAIAAAELPVRNLKIDVEGDTVLHLGMTVVPADARLRSEGSLTLAPVVSAAADSAALPAVILSGRNNYLRHLRGSFGAADASTLLRAWSAEIYNYSARIPYRGWMDSCTVSIRAIGGCCGAADGAETTPVATIAMETDSCDPEFVFPGSITLREKVQTLEGRSFIDFRVNRTEIDSTYRRNPAELARILATIDTVRANPDATITRIDIKGFASPEGSYTNNMRLAQARTEALKLFVAVQYNFPDNVISTSYEPENWAGLRDSIAAGQLPHRLEILDVIDSDLEPDARDAALRQRFPDDYRYILSTIYPALRRTDYKVTYSIRSYSDLDEIRHVLATRPENLSIDELYLLASSYPAGSAEQRAVMEQGIRLFPDDPGMRRAAEALSRPPRKTRVIKLMENKQ